MLQPEDFFDLKEVGPNALFQDAEFVWEALGRLKAYLKETLSPNVSRLCGEMITKTHVLWEGEVIEEGFVIAGGDASKGELKVLKDGVELQGASVVCAGAVLSDDQIQIGRGSIIEPGALVKGPTRIGDHTEVRQGAYMRGNCLVGNGCVVGHTTEMKSSIMLDGAKAGHFAYIGDSILGNHVNLGAGTKLANLKIVDTGINLRIEGQTYKTGLRKFGAILGDKVEMGCNSVSSPGTLLGKDSLVYPTVNVPGGYYPNNSVVSIRSKKILAVKSFKRR
jgi:acetyltransferase-like isoleucine patch superfamily enzyme